MNVEVVLSVTILNAIAGALLSLLMEYIPSFANWYALFTSQQKKQLMGMFLIVSTVLVFIGSCFGPFDIVACTPDGFWQVSGTLISALLAGGIPANQAVHRLTKKD